jgi:hypothetical protein
MNYLTINCMLCCLRVTTTQRPPPLSGPRRQELPQIRLCPRYLTHTGMATRPCIASALRLRLMSSNQYPLLRGDALPAPQRHGARVAPLGVGPALEAEEAAPDGAPHPGVVGVQRSRIAEVEESVEEHVHDLVGLAEAVPRAVLTRAEVHRASVGLDGRGGVLHLDVLVPQERPCAQVRRVQLERALEVLHGPLVPPPARVVVPTTMHVSGRYLSTATARCARCDSATFWSFT